MAGTTAVVFPGQGSQRAGMAADFTREFPEARDAFAEASDTLGLDLAALCRDGDRLALTEFQQPAILVAEVAMFRTLVSAFGLAADLFGGHSLGEYAALVAAGVVDLPVAATLVRERGRLMQEAAPEAGAMAALIAKPGTELTEPAVSSGIEDLDVDIANINAPDQIVLSGLAEDLDRALATLRGGGMRLRVKRLRVSAPFHSRFMKSAAAAFRPVLEDSGDSWRCERARRVASNYSGSFHSGERQALFDALGGQLRSPVRWADNMRAIASAGDKVEVIEVGPGRPLGAFFKSIGIVAASVKDVAGARALAALRGRD